MVDGFDGGIKSVKISDSCIRRISIYFRTLNLLERKEVRYITSEELAEINGRYPAQVRKDLSYFGCFGVRGIGYEVSKLKNALGRVLGLNRGWGLVVIGSVQYSDILMNSLALKSNNFNVNKIYDKNPELYKGTADHIDIFHIDRMEETLDPVFDNIAIIALPPAEVQSVINRLSRIGVRAALYLASRSVKVPDNMVIVNQDVSIELGMLTYRLNEGNRV
ncbi:MAG: redox-sensing transcriptional repressor Rex [Deltaproteobacteria bacterium]|nr:redox-sensing transcriptional repressor Rex [Deltaproteobacteria bacterium]